MAKKLFCILFSVAIFIIFVHFLNTMKLFYGFNNKAVCHDCIRADYLNDTGAPSEKEYSNEIPTIYVITPTHTRLEQKADLTRLSYTLRHVPRLHWILVEDSVDRTRPVANFLQRSTLSYSHLNAITPDYMKLQKGENRHKQPRGVLQRNTGIDWIRLNVHARAPGVVYFADDDNTYDIRLFEEMRYTQKVSVWPVGLVASQRYESPILENGKVISWLTTWAPERTFATDMAGFAINISFLHAIPSLRFRNKKGRLESDLLTQLNVTLDDLEPKADNCTKVLVWHTRTVPSSIVNENILLRKFGRKTDASVEV